MRNVAEIYNIRLPCLKLLHKPKTQIKVVQDHNISFINELCIIVVIYFSSIPCLFHSKYLQQASQYMEIVQLIKSENILLEMLSHFSTELPK